MSSAVNPKAAPKVSVVVSQSAVKTAPPEVTVYFPAFAPLELNTTVNASKDASLKAVSRAVAASLVDLKCPVASVKLFTPASSVKSKSFDVAVISTGLERILSPSRVKLALI